MIELSLENKDKILACLNNGECFICGKKNLKIPFLHIEPMHSISANYTKDILLISHKVGFACEESSQRMRKTAMINGFGTVYNDNGYANKGRKYSDIRNKKNSYIAKQRDKKHVDKYLGQMNTDEAKIKRQLTRFGCEPSLYYAKLVYELTNGSIEYVKINYTNTATRIHVKVGTLQKNITNHAFNNNLIEIKYDNRMSIYARITEKAINILKDEVMCNKIKEII